MLADRVQGWNKNYRIEGRGLGLAKARAMNELSEKAKYDGYLMDLMIDFVASGDIPAERVVAHVQILVQREQLTREQADQVEKEIRALSNTDLLAGEPCIPNVVQSFRAEGKAEGDDRGKAVGKTDGKAEAKAEVKAKLNDQRQRITSLCDLAARGDVTREWVIHRLEHMAVLQEITAQQAELAIRTLG